MTDTKKRKDIKPPVFDYADFLERIDGDVDLLKEVIEIFLEDTPRLLADLFAAIRRGDAGAVERAAHTLKGATANISAKRLYALSHQVQQAAKNGDAASLEPRIHQFAENFDKLTRELKKYLAS